MIMKHPLVKSNEFLFSRANLGREILRTGAPAPLKKEWNSVLITGSTGFIGGFFLEYLEENPESENLLSGKMRQRTSGERRGFLECMQLKCIWKEKFYSRIRIIKGDLNLPKLGLSSKYAFPFFAERIDVIFHLGASVNWISDYTREAQTNVNSFTELLKLALTGDVKPIHYCSSMGTYASVISHSLILYLRMKYFMNQVLYMVDIVSLKWVCEKLIEKARMRNVPIQFI